MKKSSTTFTSQMASFFRALEKNNQREWFGPRKELFETHVRGPMIALVTQLNEKMRTLSADHVADDPARAIYRIYRDTRFSKDKTPYKTHIAATFRHRSLPRHAGAGFYVEVSHKYVGIAGGVYMPGPEELKAIRTAIAAEGEPFLKMAEGRKTQKMFGALQGEKLARVPKGWEAHGEGPVAGYLKYKQFYWWVELPAREALSPQLGATVLKHFEALSEGVAWFNRVLLAELKRQEDGTRPQRPAPMW